MKEGSKQQNEGQRMKVRKWPTECPTYLHWYKLLYPNKGLTTKEKFQVLCSTYIALSKKRNCNIPDVLAQTCWMNMEKNGRLHVDEDD